VRDRDFGRRSGSDVAHLDDFDVALAGAVERGVGTVSRRARVRVVHEQGRVGSIGRDYRGRAGLVRRVDAGARGGRDDRRNPDVLRREVEVEVQDFLGVLAFQEADLDRLAEAVEFTTDSREVNGAPATLSRTV